MGIRKTKSRIICRCNNVTVATIEEAIKGGCKTMNEIFDATTAGVGACGGSCRKYILPMLNYYLENGRFHESNKQSSSSHSNLEEKKERRK